MTDTKTGGGFWGNVVPGVLNYLKKPEVQAVLDPLEAELIAHIFALLETHAEKTATPVDNIVVNIAKKAAAGTLIQAPGAGNP